MSRTRRGRSSAGHRRLPRSLRRAVPLLVGLAALVSLVLAVQPARLVEALRHLRVAWVPALVGLSLGYYVFQGLRWHVLLRLERVRIGVADTVLLNQAGQTTALLPLGELSRAVFVSKATGAPLGRVTATVTVQELTYSILLIAVAVPGAFHHRAAAVGVLCALVGVVTAFVILTVPSVFRRVHRQVRRVPGLRRFAPAIGQLQRDTRALLRRPRTYTSAWISLIQVGFAVTLMWAAIQALAPVGVPWHRVAFVYAVINVGSAISLSPGGLGAFELGTAGLLVSVGLDFPTAGAVALLHRLADKGVGLVVGGVCYAVARRRHDLGATSLLGMRQADADGAGERGRTAAAPRT